MNRRDRTGHDELQKSIAPGSLFENARGFLVCLIHFLRVARTFEVNEKTKRAITTPTNVTGTTIAKTMNP